jgi:hypothetical protein
MPRLTVIVRIEVLPVTLVGRHPRLRAHPAEQPNGRRPVLRGEPRVRGELLQGVPVGLVGGLQEDDPGGDR